MDSTIGGLAVFGVLACLSFAAQLGSEEELSPQDTQSRLESQLLTNLTTSSGNVIAGPEISSVLQGGEQSTLVVLQERPVASVLTVRALQGGATLTLGDTAVFSLLEGQSAAFSLNRGVVSWQGLDESMPTTIRWVLRRIPGE